MKPVVGPLGVLRGRDDTEQVAQGCGTVYNLEMIVIKTLI
jgi:hypothetical protein